VVVLRVAFSLDVPIFNRSNDVSFISLAKLDFDLVALLEVGVL